MKITKSIFIIVCIMCMLFPSCRKNSSSTKKTMTISRDQFDIKTEKIRNFESYAVANADRLRFRAQNDLNSRILRHLNKGDIVRILKKDSKKVKIGEVEDYWYQIDLDGTRGWAFGYYLDIYLTRDDAEIGASQYVKKSELLIESEEVYDTAVNDNLYYLRDGALFKIMDVNARVSTRVDTGAGLMISNFFFSKKGDGIFYIGKNPDSPGRNGDLYFLSLEESEVSLIANDVYTARINNEKSVILMVGAEKAMKKNSWTIRLLDVNNFHNITDVTNIDVEFTDEELENDYYLMTIKREHGSLIKLDFGDNDNFIYFKPPEENFTYLISVLTGDYIQIETDQEPAFSIDNHQYITIYSEENQTGNFEYSLVLKDKLSGMEKPIFKSILYPLHFTISPRKNLLAITMIDITKKIGDFCFSSIYVISLNTYATIEVTEGGNSYHPHWQPGMLK